MQFDEDYRLSDQRALVVFMGQQARVAAAAADVAVAVSGFVRDGLATDQCSAGDRRLLISLDQRSVYRRCARYCAPARMFNSLCPRTSRVA